jgi:hypothetical protein
MKFEFTKPTSCKLQNLNPRDELHGTEHHLAVDLKLSRVAGNDCLEDFAPGLQEALFGLDDGNGKTAPIPGMLPNLRFPALGTLAYDGELTGCTVSVKSAVTGRALLELPDCKVNAFRLDLAQGGSVTTTFRVQCNRLPDGALDKLGKMLGHDVEMTIAPPTVAEDKPGSKQNVTPIKSAGQASKDAFDKAGNPFGDGSPEQTLIDSQPPGRGTAG